MWIRATGYIDRNADGVIAAGVLGLGTVGGAAPTPSPSAAWLAAAAALGLAATWLAAKRSRRTRLVFAAGCTPAVVTCSGNALPEGGTTATPQLTIVQDT
jgi:hypothetical protein